MVLCDAAAALLAGARGWLGSAEAPRSRSAAAAVVGSWLGRGLAASRMAVLYGALVVGGACLAGLAGRRERGRRRCLVDCVAACAPHARAGPRALGEVGGGLLARGWFPVGIPAKGSGCGIFSPPPGPLSCLLSPPPAPGSGSSSKILLTTNGYHLNVERALNER